MIAAQHSVLRNSSLYRCFFCEIGSPLPTLVHLTGGILRHFQALSTPKQNPALEVLSMPAHPQVTQTVGRFAENVNANK